MNRVLYVYDMNPQVKHGRDKKLPNDLEKDFVEIVKHISKLDEVKRKKDLSMDDKILYLDSYQYDSQNHIVNLCFISAKYNSSRNVVDTSTLKNRGILKSKIDGDKEKNHLAIKFYDNNKPICLFEKNYYGIGFQKIMDYLNDWIKKNHEENDLDIRYRYLPRSVVSKDFLRSLEKAHKIKAVTLVVNREDLKVSDTKALSGKNELSDDVEIVLRPARGNILHTTVQDFFKKYNDKGSEIKRITVKGEFENKTSLSFDTEQMKEKICIEVAINSITEEVLTEDIYKCFLNELEDLQ